MRLLNIKTDKQQGLALFVSLVFLLILTILGISAMQTTIMEEKMAGNFNDLNRAFQAAETGLRVAENWLQGLAAQPVDNTSPSTEQVWSLMEAGALCTGTQMWWRDCNSTWWKNSAAQASSVSLSDVATAPYYLIEKQAFISDSLNIGGGKGDDSGRSFYRITSKGTGGNNLTRMLLQTSYARRF